MADQDILSSLTWPGAFDPPEQGEDFTTLEMSMEKLEINSSPEDTEARPMADAESHGGRHSQTGATSQAASDLLNDIRVRPAKNI